MKYRSFYEARKYVRTLGLQSQDDWFSWCKSKDRPTDIPVSADKVYKDRGWKGYGDWLGTNRTSNRDKAYRPFPEARNLAVSLKLGGKNEWIRYAKSGKLPLDIPRDPYGQYLNKGWTNWGDWLGTGNTKFKNFRPFLEARRYARSLELTSTKEWEKYCKSGNRPDDIPLDPWKVYRNKGWKNIGDWLGIEIMPFDRARRLAQTLKLKSRKEWSDYCRSGKLPKGIPAYPENAYKKLGWKNYGDWLGTHYIATNQRKYRSFNEAKRFINILHLKSRPDWTNYCISGNKPDDIPSSPARVYAKEWKGWGDWLGTGTLAPSQRQYRSFSKARLFARSLEFENIKDWTSYCKSGKKPNDIPADPSKMYKDKGWKNYGDWLGTGTLAPSQRQYQSFYEAREYVHTLGFKSSDEWFLYAKSGKKPDNIPADPRGVYKHEWNGMEDWLGYTDKDWDTRRIKELLQDLIKSKKIYAWQEAVLYSFFLRNGLLNLSSNNQYTQFFNNFTSAIQTKEGIEVIEKFVNSNSQQAPDLSSIIKENEQVLTKVNDEIENASSKEISEIREEDDPLHYRDLRPTKDILSTTNFIESINVDKEAIQFYLNHSVDELWKNAFIDGGADTTFLTVKNEEKNGNKYHDAVIETFLSDYESIQKMDRPKNYAFPFDPTLMQKYVAYKIKTNPYFGNFSGTGAGKTLSAVLSSRVCNSRMTVIVCPNDIVEQWSRSIKEIFPNSIVITGKDAFYALYNKTEYQYLVLNYDKFSLEESPNLIYNLGKQYVDFVILDEIHFVKKHDDDSSKRRRNLEGLMTLARKNNDKIRVLGLSATPIVNNLLEGKSLLELITGKIYQDIVTRPTVPNAVALYEKLSTISIRELPQYNIDTLTEHVEVQAEKPPEIKITYLKKNPLSIEQLLTDARLPKIIELIKDQTIIYTEYITEVIQKISRAVQKAGLSYALYTGQDKSGLSRFLDRKVQVLIASRPISVGVDGLQNICSRLIINTLPWTNAQYQQLLGRLVRKGQIRDVVHVYVVKAKIGGYPYDELKWKRILFKRTLADCAVDGRLPQKNLVTPQQAAMEAVRWLERLERGEISTIARRDLEVELAPVEIKKRIRKYGDFTRLNNQINNELSTTTFNRMKKDPKLWEEYHRQYRESRKLWSVVPYEEIIKRLSRLPKRLHMADFGCGEAKIMEAFQDRIVYSFDHIAINDKVISCNMKSVPLPEEELDVAIFSLSLMGRDWRDYIIEAKRCLATNGYLFIAETTKSLREGGRLSKLGDVLKKEGFDIESDKEIGDFTFIEAREYQ